MKFSLMSVPVSDQGHALDFYINKLGFNTKRDIPLGDARWLTVVSPEDPDGPELLLEPNAEYPEIKALKEALVRDGIPVSAFEVDDVELEYRRLTELGVKFTQGPTDFDGTKFAVLDDTCGNLIQIYQESG